MKVTITTPFARLSVEMDAMKAATLLTEALIAAVPDTAQTAKKRPSHGAYADLFTKDPEDSADCDEPATKREDPVIEFPTITPPVTPVAAPQSDDGFDPDMDDRVGFSAEEETPEKGYRGFLHVKCAKCHKEHSFCTKKALKEYRCECGHTTPLKGLNKIVAKCDCGQDMKYFTNHDADSFELKCPRCDKPALVQWSFRHKRYEKAD